MSQPIKRVVIAGGGTAGWMAASALAKLLGKVLDVTLVESDEIGTVGVGEATIPTLVFFNKLLGINEAEFMAATNATFKLGINFRNWRNINHEYIHAFGVTGRDCWAAGFQHFWLKAKEFGIDAPFGDYCLEQVCAQAGKFAHLPNNGLNYAFHIDATRYAAFLRKIAEQHGAKRIEGKIAHVHLHPESGDISQLELVSGQTIEGDLFIDCTGFRGLLIEQSLNTGYEDWSHWLPNDSAVAIQTASSQPAIPYTNATAHHSGWQWQIPLQSRIGNGLVYSSRYLNDADAISLLTDNLTEQHLTEPRVIKFKTGRRRKQWNKNCVALGLASGFLEPLESTSIHLIQQGIVRLMRMFPHTGIKQCDIDEYNQQTAFDVEKIRDFIILHYKVTERRDSPYWRYLSSMEVPDTLAHRIELFSQTGRVFREGNELFDDSWQQVMIGQGLVPQQYHPIVNQMSEQELRGFMSNITNRIAQTLAPLPSMNQYIAKYCKSAL